MEQDISTRRRIFLFIDENPGMHFRGLQRDLELSVGQLDYHLNKLEKDGAITKEDLQGNARFFPSNQLSKSEKRIMGYLRREIPRNIILYLLEKPDSTPTQILEIFNFSGPNLSYHLRRLVSANIITVELDGRMRCYSVTDKKIIEKLIVTYRTTLFDRIVDNFA